MMPEVSSQISDSLSPTAIHHSTGALEQRLNEKKGEEHHTPHSQHVFPRLFNPRAHPRARIRRSKPPPHHSPILRLDTRPLSRHRVPRNHHGRWHETADSHTHPIRPLGASPASYLRRSWLGRRHPAHDIIATTTPVTDANTQPEPKR